MDSHNTLNTPKGLTRKQLADAAGIGAETVRFYETRGLLPEPRRSPAGYRIYGQADIERLNLIRRSQQLGFTLGEIQELIALTELPGAHRAELKERAEAKLRNIEEKIRDLRAISASLSTLVESCNGKGSVAACPIYKFMSGEAVADTTTSPFTSTSPSSPNTNSGDHCHV